MRARDAARPTDLADQLAGLHLLAHPNIDLLLVIIGRVNAPAMIDEGCVAAHSERTCKDDRAGRSRVNIKRMIDGANAVIKARMEVVVIASIKGAAPAKPILDAVIRCDRQRERSLPGPGRGRGLN